MEKRNAPDYSRPDKGKTTTPASQLTARSRIGGCADSELGIATK
jgi:hypothetical protein